MLLVQLREFHRGQDAYAWFQSVMGSLPMLLLTIIVFVFVLFHAISWFVLIGKAQPIQFTAKPLPWQRVFVANLGVWVVVSVLVVFLVFGGL